MMEAGFLLFGAYLITIAVCFFFKDRRVMSAVSIIAACVAIVSVLLILNDMRSTTDFIIDMGPIYIDRVSLFFMSLISFVALMAILYSRGYMWYEADEGAIRFDELRKYYIVINTFIMVMYMTFMVKSLAVIWVCVGATTLVSTFLVGFYRNDHSTEAAWKYMMLCSVGITIALIGIMLTYAATIGVIGDEDTALDWPILYAYAAGLDPSLMKMATVLVIIGFGTKVGFAPMHTWLPDAHSQAPTPVSGMLSAVLLNCAFYAVIRFYMISEAVLPGFAKNVLLIFGILSLFVAACFIVVSRDIKRMLAYSSIENMGLIAIGLGIGTELAIFGAMFQMMAHSVTKPLLFFSAGNIVQQYDTRNMQSITGVREKMPFTAFMMGAGALIIVGVPPFSVFVGEFCIIMASVSAGAYAVVAISVSLLAIVFAGFVMHVFPMLSGHTDRDVSDPKGRIRALPFMMMFVTTLILGLFMPEQMSAFMNDLASQIGGML